MILSTRITSKQNASFGLAQSDEISGTKFIISFENALKEIQYKRQTFKQAKETSNIPRDKTRPPEAFHADDTVFIDIKTEHSKRKQENSTTTLKKYNRHASQKQPRSPSHKEMQ